MSRKVLPIRVYWKNGANGYPWAEDVKASAPRNQTVRILWIPDDDITIDDIDFQQNPPAPHGSIQKPKPEQQSRYWTAIDTIKGNDRLKYVIQATHERFGQKTSPDPDIENEVEPIPIDE